MKITYLCEYGSINGAEKSLLAVLRLLPRAEFSPQVVAPPTGPFAAELDRLVIPRVCWPGDFAGLSLAEKRRHLENILREYPTDLVHANSLSMGRLCGPVISGVTHLRDIIRLSRSAVDDLNRHKRLFAVSEAAREFHVRQGIDPVKCVTLHNGVDLHEFRPKTPTKFLHRELGIPESARLLGCIGQLGMRKGQDVLLDAVEPILLPLELRLLLVGERFSGKDEAVRFEKTLRDRVARKPLVGRVHFLGIRNDIPDLLPELTLLAHPARQEPLGRVLLEAAACGVAVIATDVGGTAEILPCRSQLILPGDSGQLRGKIVAACENVAWRQEIAVKSREVAESRLSDTTAVERLIRYYKGMAWDK